MQNMPYPYENPAVRDSATSVLLMGTPNSACAVVNEVAIKDQRTKLSPLHYIRQLRCIHHIQTSSPDDCQC